MNENTLAGHHAALAKLTAALTRVTDCWKRELADFDEPDRKRQSYPYDEIHKGSILQRSGISGAKDGSEFALYACVEFVNRRIFFYGASENGHQRFRTMTEPDQCTEALAKSVAQEFRKWVAAWLEENGDFAPSNP